jgi:hypothetical protein
LEEAATVKWAAVIMEMIAVVTIITIVTIVTYRK